MPLPQSLLLTQGGIARARGALATQKYFADLFD